MQSEGVDLQLSGSPLPGWQVAGGYTYVLAKYRQDKIYRRDTGYLTQQGGYALVGLTAGYRLREQVQLRERGQAA